MENCPETFWAAPRVLVDIIEFISLSVNEFADSFGLKI